MPKIRAYIIDHDYGIALRIEGDTCILDGCRKNDIQKAEVGDWIVGIGGKGLGHTKGNKGRYDRKLGSVLE